MRAMRPPRAAIVPHRLEIHGHVRIDNYYWLKERDNPEVLAYLKAENAYTGKMMKHTRTVQEKLFREIKDRIRQTDMSVPYREEDYFYYTRFEEGREYALHCRKKEALSAAEELLLDGNLLAEGHSYFSLGGRAISAGQDILAFAVDTVGRRIYTVRFKNLATGELFEDRIEGATGNIAWANDNRTLFYARQDPLTLRSHRIFCHRLGQDQAGDRLVYEEADETFNCYVFKTKSKKYLMIGAHQTLSSEYRFLEADNPDGDFKVLQPREAGHEYQVDHYDGKFYIRTNLQALNFRLMETPLDRTGQDNWREVIGHREDVLLEYFEIFRDYLVVEERREGLVKLRIIPWSGEGEHYLDFGEPAYLAYIGTNREFNTRLLRFGYSSLTTPNSVYDYDMRTREKKLQKRDEVLGGFDTEDYRTERLYATARDGVRVPVSLVYRKGMGKKGGNPLLLYGYGAYGHSSDPVFSSARLSLLDRGFIFAIAHARGGEELGRQWYEEGRQLRKKNTFTDFIDCAEYLIGQGYTGPERLFVQGGSAGGLLMGAVVNLRPELFRGVIARVPFVDVLTTMLDPDIPLTTGEYDEWGDPNRKEFYDYMLSYSPYDNLETKEYPNLLVTTGLHDSQVQYWEPAKWVARLRALKTGDNVLLLKTRMDAGHGGVSGRFRRYRETAFEYAFLLDLAGIRQ